MMGRSAFLSANRFSAPDAVAEATQIQGVKELVIGRALLFPRGDDVVATVDQLVEVL